MPLACPRRSRAPSRRSRPRSTCETSLLQADTHPRLHYATDRRKQSHKSRLHANIPIRPTLQLHGEVEISGTISHLPAAGPIAVVEVVHLAVLPAVQSVHRVMVQPSREKKQ